MKKKTKTWILIAASLFIAGCILFGGVMSMLKWDFKKLSTVKYETNTHIISEEFREISLITDTADIHFQPSDDGKCKVICYEEESLKHSVYVQSNKLTIQINDERKWYDHIGINFNTPKITVYLPLEAYDDLAVQSSTGDTEVAKEFTFKNIFIKTSTGHITNYASATEDLQIKTTTGSIRIDTISVGNLDLSVTTGKINARSVNCNEEFKIHVGTGDSKIIDTKCNTLISTGTTGDLTLKNVIAKGKISTKRTTGDVNFEQCDAAELYIKTTTGDVDGSLCSEKIFIVHTSTGDVTVPQTTTGGKCEISTSTGDININIAK